jgi:hypothetical protein
MGLILGPSHHESKILSSTNNCNYNIGIQKGKLLKPVLQKLIPT